MLYLIYLRSAADCRFRAMGAMGSVDPSRLSVAVCPVSVVAPRLSTLSGSLSVIPSRLSVAVCPVSVVAPRLSVISGSLSVVPGSRSVVAEVYRSRHALRLSKERRSQEKSIINWRHSGTIS
ncbi:hypothetical protein OYT88_07625 [Sporolactobacillus sp. CQH2019]|uniref:hypothetical protein n=1 Tax=Sporolactobacillus sp. CQH2019 TaxID=3023512 RepID=UPI002368D689|nr:hypothetical protein [Sporolactobacillus sp. CQH2019]MDD9148418.1 hypothetical protein [Sporolactobacillus sp. CQH2019]